MCTRWGARFGVGTGEGTLSVLPFSLFPAPGWLFCSRGVLVLIPGAPPLTQTFPLRSQATVGDPLPSSAGPERSEELNQMRKISRDGGDGQMTSGGASLRPWPPVTPANPWSACDSLGPREEEAPETDRCGCSDCENSDFGYESSPETQRELKVRREKADSARASGRLRFHRSGVGQDLDAPSASGERAAKRNRRELGSGNNCMEAGTDAVVEACVYREQV